MTLAGITPYTDDLYIFYMDMLKPTIRGRLRSNLFLIWFSVIEMLMLVAVFIALLNEQYGLAIFGAVVLFCSIPFYGMAWGMRN